jgi:allophanate hydrolase
MTALLRIEAAGPLTSVQDRGRPGWRRFGVPPSGPVDRRAFAAALTAIGAADDASAIELSHGGLTIVGAEVPIAIALTGAAVATIDAIEIGGWCVATLPAGARCRVRVERGNWGYLAIAGSLNVPAWLNSRSTHLIAGLGGGALAAGSRLAVDAPRDDLAATAIPQPPDATLTTARAILGPQQRFFDDATLALLTAEPFAASARFDRMGMVLGGPAMLPTSVDMPSEPAIRGALQVDGDGRPSLLTADHQTTGGYPRVAVVVEPDIDRLARLPAGAPVRFALIEPAEAITLTRAAAARNAAWLAQIAAGRRPRPSLLSVNLIGGVVDALRPC